MKHVVVLGVVMLLLIPSAFAIWNYVIGCGVGAVVGLFVGGIGVNCYDYQWTPDMDKSKDNYQCTLCNNFNEFGLDEDLTSYFEPCTEYRCKSIGKLCEFKEFEEEEGAGICVRKDCSKEFDAPKITNCEVRDPDTTNKYNVAQTENGCKILDPIPEFDGAAIMLNISEAGQCRFSTVPDFTETNSVWFGSPNFDTAHFFLLSVYDANETVIQECNSGDCNLYVKCGDVCDNTMGSSYAISFNIKEGPDLESPRIVDTLVESGAMVPAGIENIEFSMSVFDHSNIESCKWATDEFEEYEDIKNTFDCKNDFGNVDVVANFLEEGIFCETTLTGLEDDEDNIFYFSCRDDSEQKNTLKPYVEFILKGTTPLNITNSHMPEGTLYSLNYTVTAVTNRDANCYYKINNRDREEFNNTGLTSHSAEVKFDPGQVNLEILCHDIAGNEDSVTGTFRAEEDTKPPTLVRLYSDASYLTVVLDEEAKCEYSDEQFIFEDGTVMVPADYSKEHRAAIGQDVYYIKCRDVYENELSFTVYP